MTGSRWIAVALLVAGPGVLAAQFGGFGGGGRRGGGMGQGEYAPPAPKLPFADIEGPPDSATAQSALALNDTQAALYAQVYDSFIAATRPARDSASQAIDVMHDRLDGGDRAAAEFYAERAQDIGHELHDRQDRFEDRLRHLLSGEQWKSYRQWKDDQERAADEKDREEALRWREASFGGGGGGGAGRVGMTAAPEQRIFVSPPPGVAPPALGGEGVRAGRTLYIASQLALDSSGALVGAGDLRAQAVRAFANLAAVLRATNTWPQDVVSLTIYVVNYKEEDLAIIRDAGASYFGINPPVTTVLGVEALARDGALIAVGATAMAQGGVGGMREGRDR